MDRVDGLIPARKLSARLEVEGPGEDVRGLSAGHWRAHCFSKPYRASGVYPEATLWRDNARGPAAAACPHLARLVREFPANVRTARLASLDPGVRITSHVDREGRYQDDAVTLHLPVITNPDARLVVAGRGWHMAAGELWFVDTYCLHSAVNRGDEPRVHLVLSCEPDDAINDVLGFDIVAYRKSNLFTYHRHYVNHLRREARWARLYTRAEAG